MRSNKILHGNTKRTKKKRICDVSLAKMLGIQKKTALIILHQRRQTYFRLITSL